MTSLLFPGLMSAFGIFLMRQFFAGVPDELLDAGRIDGLSELSIYRKIALPLVKPALSAGQDMIHYTTSCHIIWKE